MTSQSNNYEAAERDAWIAAHGSERLREAVALGLGSAIQKSYRNERLHAERPGWRYASDRNGLDIEEQIVEPTIEWMAELRSTRINDPGASLVWLVEQHETDCEQECADGDRPQYCRCGAYAEAALTTNFHGRRIVFGLGGRP